MKAGIRVTGENAIGIWYICKELLQGYVDIDSGQTTTTTLFFRRKPRLVGSRYIVSRLTKRSMLKGRWPCPSHLPVSLRKVSISFLYDKNRVSRTLRSNMYRMWVMQTPANVASLMSCKIRLLLTLQLCAVPP